MYRIVLTINPPNYPSDNERKYAPFAMRHDSWKEMVVKLRPTKTPGRRVYMEF